MTLKAIFIIIVFLPIIFLNKVYLKNNKRYYNIIFLLLIICLNFSLKMNYSQYVLDDEQYLYIPAFLFLAIIIHIATINIKSKKITLDNVFIFILLTSFIIGFINNEINNKVKFWSMTCMYGTIFMIGLIYKNIEGYYYERITNLFTNLAIYNGLLGIAQFITNKKLLIGFFNDNIYYMQGGENVKRIVGIAATNNAGGNLGAILFSVVFFNYMKKKNTKNFIALASTSIFSVLTLTRIGYLAICVELVIYFLLTKWESLGKIIKKFSLVILLGICIAGILVVFGDQLKFILFEQRGSTVNSRGDQFIFVFNNIVKNNLFWMGIGAGQYKYYVYYYFGYTDIDIHSQYINLLVENGWIICSIFLVFNIYLFVTAIKKCDDKLQKAFVIALFTGNFICMNFNPNQEYMVNNWLYYLLIYCFVYKENNGNDILNFRNNAIIRR